MPRLTIMRVIASVKERVSGRRDVGSICRAGGREGFALANRAGAAHADTSWSTEETDALRLPRLTPPGISAQLQASWSESYSEQTACDQRGRQLACGSRGGDPRASPAPPQL